MDVGTAALILFISVLIDSTAVNIQIDLYFRLVESACIINHISEYLPFRSV